MTPFQNNPILAICATALYALSILIVVRWLIVKARGS